MATLEDLIRKKQELEKEIEEVTRRERRLNLKARALKTSVLLPPSQWKKTKKRV